MVKQNSSDDFQKFLAGLRARIVRHGISPKIFDNATQKLAFLPDVLEKETNQGEFTLSLKTYMDRVLSPKRIRKGRTAYKDRRALFNQIETEFGVEAQIVAAVWGAETDFGRERGNTPVLAALMTLTWKGRRTALFEQEAIAALNIVQQKRVMPDDLTGSWAGAMGHCQFMPSSYLKYAVDLDGDGHSDIWGKSPDDSLASIANYLARHGWQSGAPWGVEVTLPDGFDLAQSGLDQALPLSEWLTQGITLTDGSKPADYGAASLLLPCGVEGPAFLAFANFKVLMLYNNSVFYALSVAMLSEQIAVEKKSGILWPDLQPLNRLQMTQLQTCLTEKGFDAGKADGLIGPDTIAAIRSYQRKAGLPADGYPGMTLFKQLCGT